MGIVDEDIVRVRETTDIVALITQYTQLKRVGQRWSGLCPFHSEKTPSFSVNASEGFYYCFGCKEHGDAITFVRNMEHLDFVGAVERLAATAGIVLRYTDQNDTKNCRLTLSGRSTGTTSGSRPRPTPPRRARTSGLEASPASRSPGTRWDGRPTTGISSPSS
jgi:DNA primase